MKVVIVFGSLSDKEKMSGAARALEEFGISYEAAAISAHRAPDLLEERIKRWEEESVFAIIAGAGLAAHLPGVIASKTVIPVIGVPLSSKPDGIGGMDALYAIVQMPKSIPVATVGIDNAYNAAMVAVQMIGRTDRGIEEKLIRFRAGLAAKIRELNEGGIEL